MKCLAIILASLCLSLEAFTQQQTLPVVQTYYYAPNNGDDLVPGSQTAYQYDKHGRLRSTKSYYWIEEEKRWVLTLSIKSDYDDVGNLITEKTTFWNADTLHNTNTVTQKFDAQNRLFEYSQLYEEPRNGYNSEAHSLYIYDQYGCNYEIRQKYVVDGSVSSEGIITYLTDEQCRTQVWRSYQTSTTEGAHYATVYRYEDNWEVARHQYYVDTDTTLLAEFFFDYDQSGRLVFMQVTGSGREYYGYDEAGNLTSVRSDYWNGETMSWERNAEVYQSFNSDNKVLVTEGYYYPTPMGVWQYSNVVSYEYNNDGGLSRVHTKSGYTFGPEFESVKDIIYRCDGLESETTVTIIQGEWPGLAQRTITTYNHPPGCDNAESLSMIIAPNPTSSFLRLLFDDIPDAVTIQIISSNGQLAKVVTPENVINPLELDVSALGAGVYIVQAISSGGVATGRFVKN